MSDTEEFKVNRFLSLRLEGDETVIYIAEESFRTCKAVLVSIERDDISSYDNIDSIDEILDRIRNKWAKLPKSEDISPEEEFWGHCSNLQTWTENQYDTNILAYSLSFQLLKKLTEAGDSQARKIFKLEIFKRLESNYAPVIRYLGFHYMDYLTHEEQVMALLLPKEANIIFTIENELGIEFKFIPDLTDYDDRIGFSVENKRVNALCLTKTGIHKIPDAISNLSSLKLLLLDQNNLNTLPESIGTLKGLEWLNLEHNQLESLPASISNLESLKGLLIANNRLNSLPNSLGNLSSLEILTLQANQLSKLPDAFGKLKSLRLLSLEENKFTSLPECIKSLPSLNSVCLKGIIKYYKEIRYSDDGKERQFIKQYKNETGKS